MSTDEGMGGVTLVSPTIEYAIFFENQKKNIRNGKGILPFPITISKQPQKAAESTKGAPLVTWDLLNVQLILVFVIDILFCKK